MGQAVRLRAEIAIHEAGHFVVAHHFGYSIANVITIDPNGDTLGEILSEGGDWDNPEDAFATLMELLAGYRAQMRIAPLGRSLHGADHDLEMALRILRTAFAQDTRFATFFRARRETDAILTARWEHVLGIAGLLLECGSIDGETADMWLDYASGAEGVDAATVSHYLTMRAAVRDEDLDRESIPTPEDVVEQWKRYVEIAREACEPKTSASRTRLRSAPSAGPSRQKARKPG
ncbi:MAG: hypothetical protein PVH21_17790 [Myxococcales bacterium]